MNSLARRAGVLVLALFLAAPHGRAVESSGPKGPDLTPASLPSLSLGAPELSAAPEVPSLPTLPAAAVPAAPAAVAAAPPGSPASPAQPASARLDVEQAAKAAVSSDPAAKLSAVIDGSRAAGGAQAPVSAADSLVADSAGESEQAFSAAYPGYEGAKLLGRAGMPFAGYAAHAVMTNVFMSVKEVGHRQIIDDILPPGGGPARQAFVELTEKILDLSERDDALGRRFAASLGRLKAQEDVARETFMRLGYSVTRQGLPENPLHRGEYWDLAAGPNAFGHMAGPLEPGTKYVFLDNSTFVVSYLENARRMLAQEHRPVENVSVVQVDLNKLQKPAQPLSVVRWKNVHTYVPGFEKRMVELAGWIAPGGRLLIENDPGPQRIGILKKLGPSIQELIRQGWAFDFDPLEQGELETLRLDKPASGASDHAARARSLKRWEEYVDAVHHAQATDPMAALMRFMMGGR